VDEGVSVKKLRDLMMISKNLTGSLVLQMISFNLIASLLFIKKKWNYNNQECNKNKVFIKTIVA
jgi:hypothetical protein